MGTHFLVRRVALALTWGKCQSSEMEGIVAEGDAVVVTGGERTLTYRPRQVVRLRRHDGSSTSRAAAR